VSREKEHRDADASFAQMPMHWKADKRGDAPDQEAVSQQISA